MTVRRSDPEKIFVRGFGAAEGIEWGFWLVLMVFWIVELDLGPLELVLLGIALEVTVLLAETPTGVVADLHSRKRSVILAQVLMGIAYFWSVSSLTFWLILPAQMLLGVGVGWLGDGRALSHPGGVVAGRNDRGSLHPWSRVGDDIC